MCIYIQLKDYTSKTCILKCLHANASVTYGSAAVRL